MNEMTSRERFARAYAHKEADRIPIVDIPWGATIERWQREGMPKDADFADFFGLDRRVHLHADNSPRYEEKVIEETEEYITRVTKWGVTLRNWKHAASTPEFIHYTIVDRPSWEAAKRRIRPDRDRIDWERLRANYPVWREKGAWIVAALWFGFDVTHAQMVGTERTLCALVEDPDWVRDIISRHLETHLALFDMIWNAGYTFDAIRWPDDMGYKGKQFFSVNTYREIVKPFHRRAIEWAHARGIIAELHSCGDVNPFVPEFVEMGLDALNPLEVKAGMDPVGIKKTWGDRLSLHGGINAVLWDQPEKIRAEMERLVPVLKQGGGYIFASDHSVPSSVSLRDFREITSLAKKLGAY